MNVRCCRCEAPNLVTAIQTPDGDIYCKPCWADFVAGVKVLLESVERSQKKP